MIVFTLTAILIYQMKLSSHSVVCVTSFRDHFNLKKIYLFH